ncbi:M4 family metallopeptidase [Cognatiluteimonas weifangensis]|uniref:M4 family metallopeptidase n=1 Tax=Cognatiluteimonas weifangensis TaxID=2303539 RepID=UPI003616B80A
MQSRLLSVAIVAVLAVPATALAAARPAHAPAVDRAIGLIDSHGPALHRADADAFLVRDVIVDRDGTEHARFDRTWRGLPVIGGDVVVHSRNGQFKGASQTLKTSIRPSLASRISSDQAIVEAGAAFGTGFDGVPSARKVIYARSGSPVLAYEVLMRGFKADQTPTEMHYFVDARSGRILDRYDSVHTAKPGAKKPGGGTTCSGTTSANGTGRTLFSGNVAISTQDCGGSFQMKDLTRGGGYTTDLNQRTNGSGTIFSDADNTWGNNTTSDRATAGADAHFGVATTWDYFKNVHGRNGIANDGKGALSRVHYGRNYVNAFWSDSCFCMTFGDGNGSTYYPLVNLDVAGHEMSHGVTSRSANLTYSGESGGLNEATSDIFGTMVEYYANNANDTPDYMIGEEIYVNNPSGTKALRYMFKPSLDGASPDCYSSGVGSLDVHYSSGIGNHAFYLMAEGATTPAGFSVTPAQLVCNGNTAAGGIGRDAAQKVWYRALTVYMTSSTNYAGARTATLNAARDLYGSGSAQYNGVASAWSAVGVN